MKIWILYALACALTHAEVVDSSASGFTVQIAMQLKGTPPDVYAKFVHNIGNWWNPEHTFFGSAKNLSIDDRAMGCFCEINPGGGSVRHMEVVFAAPGKALTMIGGLGPMQALATSGTMRIAFTPSENGTKLDVTYSVAGYAPKGLSSFGPMADGMLTEQLTRFKSYANGKS